MRDEQPIDIWGYAKALWRHKWIWLLTFAIVLAAGAGYATTRPNTYGATQSALITVPSVNSEQEATQQSSTFTSISDVLRRLATRPPIADSVLAKHPEIQRIDQLQSLVKVTGAGLLIDIEAEGADPDALKALVHDIALAMEEHVPSVLAENLPHLRVSVVPVGEPVLASVGSGRTSVLAASGLLALLIATAVTSLVAARRK